MQYITKTLHREIERNCVPFDVKQSWIFVFFIRLRKHNEHVKQYVKRDSQNKKGECFKNNSFNIFVPKIMVQLNTPLLFLLCRSYSVL